MEQDKGFFFTGKLLRGFQPVYPATLNVDLETFCNTFPFHLVFDEQVRDIFFCVSLNLLHFERQVSGQDHTSMSSRR